MCVNVKASRSTEICEKTSSAFPLEEDEQIERAESRYVDNYHGISLRTILVYLAINLISFTQLFNVVGSGAFARNIANVVGGTDKIVWLSQAIVIVTVVLGPPASQAADYWGRKWILVFACTFGFIGALVLSEANSFNQVIAGQVISSVLYISQPIGFAVASEIFPRKYRPGVQAGLNLSGGLGALCGLLGGSALMANNPYGWRTYWHIITALSGASAIIIAILYNPPLRPLQRSLTTLQKFRHLDWPAYFLLAAGLTLFTMGLSWGNNPYLWSNTHVVVTVVLGGCFILALIIHQTFIRKDGLVHHDLFKNDRNLAVALVCLFADGMIFWAANNYYSFQVSVLYETNTVLTGLHFGIAFISAILAASSVALISTFTKAIREPIVISFICFMLFYILMAISDLTSTKAVWGYPVFLGVGLGWSLTYLVTAAQLSAPPHMIAVTSGILLAVRSLGGSVALAIYTAIFDSSLSSKLGPKIAAAVIPLGFPASELEAFIGVLVSQNESALMQIHGVTPQIIAAGVNALQSAYLASFRLVWITAAVFSGMTVIVSCFMINPGKDLNNHVDAPLEE